MECSKGWAERCRASKGAKCTCACGGQNHGKNRHHEGEKRQESLGFHGDVFDFKGMGHHDSKCGVKIVRGDGKATVILTELPDNPGTSVTNAVEDIATLIYKEQLSDLPVDEITWIEHYPQRGKFEETHDRVTLSWEPSAPHWQGGKVIGTGRFVHPQWKRMEMIEVA